MDEKQKEIFIATIARTVVKKLVDSDDVGDIMPIPDDLIYDTFEEEAKRIQFNFYTLSIKELCKKVFLVGFRFSISCESVPEREIESTFKIVEKEMQIPYQLNMPAFIWFRQGIKVADNEREDFSILYNLSTAVCQNFDISKPAPLPSIRMLDNLFKNLDRSIFDDIDIDDQIEESAFAQISFQTGYILGLNMELDDDLLDVAFSTIFEDIFGETHQSGNSRLTYFILFREGFHKAFTDTR